MNDPDKWTVIKMEGSQGGWLASKPAYQLETSIGRFVEVPVIVCAKIQNRFGKECKTILECEQALNDIYPEEKK